MTRALLAGAIATAIVSALVYANAQLGFLPAFDLLAEIADFNRRIGLPATEHAAWGTHAVIGILIYGLVFAVLQPILPGNGTIEGSIFGMLAWLAMMVTFMPLAGHEVFASSLPPEVVVATLCVHLVYGAVLGLGYAALGDGD